jgi:hypothetical protein
MGARSAPAARAPWVATLSAEVAYVGWMTVGRGYHRLGLSPNE